MSKGISLLSLGLAFVLGSCTTTDTAWQRYEVEDPWVQVDGVFTVREVAVYWPTQMGTLRESRHPIVAQPMDNAYMLYWDAMTHEVQLGLLSADFPSLDQLLSKFEEWHQQAVEMEVSLDKTIDVRRVPTFYSWSDRQTWHRALPDVRFSFVTTGDMDYMLEIHIPTLEAYDSVQGYSPPIKGTRLLLPEESVEVLRKLMTPAGVQQTIAEVRRQIAARNERGADAQRNAAEQRRIEEAFD